MSGLSNNNSESITPKEGDSVSVSVEAVLLQRRSEDPSGTLKDVHVKILYRDSNRIKREHTLEFH